MKEWKVRIYVQFNYIYVKKEVYIDEAPLKQNMYIIQYKYDYSV